MFATSNDDKMIRIRALHDGKLLSKIQISESISSLFFILDDNYLIATSIEGYLFFFLAEHSACSCHNMDLPLWNIHIFLIYNLYFDISILE